MVFTWWISFIVNIFIRAVVLCLTIIGIPFGLQYLKISKLLLWPFGKEVITDFDERPFMNILWLLFGGLGVVTTFFVLALVFYITIIGIPFAKQHIKLARLSLLPFGVLVD